MDVFKLFGTIAVNNSGALTAISQTAKEAVGLGGAFGKGERAAGKSLAQIAAESGKTVNQLRSEAMKAAAEYQKQGMTASEAMRKAYADIGYSAELAHKKMDKNMDDSADSAEKTAHKMTDVFKKIGKAMAAAFSIKAVVDFGKGCTQTYANIAAEESAFAQIMGDYADTAREKLNAVADQTGVNATRMTGAMTSLTAKFKGLGYNVEDATTLATDGLLIASDAAAFWDMSLDESMSHLNSFINGSYEGGEAIGLFANDTQMATYAVEQGIIKNTKAWASLDEATKQATRLDYAKNMQKLSGATGQAAKESQEYANVMANLKEGWRQFQGVIGKPILERLVLPALRMLNDFMPVLTENVAKGIEWLETGFDKIAAYFTDVFTKDGLKLDALPKALTKMFRDVGSKIPGLLNSVGSKIRSAWTGTVWPAIQGALKMAFGVELPAWSEIERAVKDWWDKGGASKALASVCTWTLGLFGVPASVTEADVSNVLSTWWENTKGFVTKACNWVLSLFSTPADTSESEVSTVLSTWWTNTKAFVTKACNWVLGLFGAPADVSETDVSNVLSTWWTNTVSFVQSACTWALDLFSAPADVTAAKVSDVLSTWWTNTVSFVQSACTWALGIFSQPEDADGTTVADILQPWWVKAAALVKSACNWALGMFGAPEDLTEEGASAVLDTWWGKAVTFVQDACSWVLQLFGAPEELTQEKVEELIGDWWSGAVGFVESACAWALQTFGAPEPVTAETVEGVLDTWWTSAKALVQSACSWALQLFTNPTDDQKVIADQIKVWWTSAENAVVGACSWALQLFGVPEEDADKAAETLKTWWTNTKTAVQNACSWALKLFGVPENASAEEIESLLLTWWSTTKTHVQDACAWALQLFTNPETAPEQVAEKIGEWWNTAQGWVTDACAWVLQLFENPTESQEKIVEHVKAWWDTIGSAVSGACEWVLKLFKVPEDTVADVKSAVKTWWDGLGINWSEIVKVTLSLFTGSTNAEGVSWADVIVTWFNGIVETVIDLIVIPFSLITPSASAAANKVKMWWNTEVVPKLKLGISAFFEGVTGGTNLNKPDVSDGSIAGEYNQIVFDTFTSNPDAPWWPFYTGFDYVPRDNYPALLHKGEAVLTRNEADVWRSGGSTNAIVTALAQVETLLRDIAVNTGADRAVVMDTGALVGQLASGMDAKLGAISNRKGRRI